jgi:hypothetical protein
MIGGLLKSTSRVALFAAAGLLVGGVAMPSAKAADLGGDCCADLEERVAELEATTARKGNRKMSLTITGQVHRVVLWWDDGHSSKTYYGLDSTNSSSRFSFLGSARVNPSVSMGFEIMIEIEAGGTSSKVNQFDEDGKVGTQINGTAAASFNASNSDAYFGDARRVAWWIEHKDVGRLTVGRYESAGVVNTIDLAGIAPAASSSTSLLNGSFFIRGTSGQYFAMTWANIGDPASSQGRTELVRYDSPNYHGFIYSASVGEAGDYWGTMLRYAGEFSGIRIAAGIGYEKVRDVNTGAAFTPIINTSGVAGPANLTIVTPNIDSWGGAVSLMHVPTGLFVQGHYMAADYCCAGSNSGYWGQANPPFGTTKAPNHQWMIQAGIAKNWFGIGNTALYGEYSKGTDYGAGNGAGASYAVTTTAASNPLAQNVGLGFVGQATVPGATAVTNVTSTELTVWGLGITQNVDAAASTLFLGYRHFEADIISNGGKLATEPMSVVVGGAVVRF